MPQRGGAPSRLRRDRFLFQRKIGARLSGSGGIDGLWREDENALRRNLTRFQQRALHRPRPHLGQFAQFIFRHVDFRQQTLLHLRGIRGGGSGRSGRRDRACGDGRWSGRNGFWRSRNLRDALRRLVLHELFPASFEFRARTRMRFYNRRHEDQLRRLLRRALRLRFAGRRRIVGWRNSRLVCERRGKSAVVEFLEEARIVRRLKLNGFDALDRLAGGGWVIRAQLFDSSLQMTTRPDGAVGGRSAGVGDLQSESGPFKERLGQFLEFGFFGGPPGAPRPARNPPN